MIPEQTIGVVKNYLKQKPCFGLKASDGEECRCCPIATECAPMRVARLAYERQLYATVARPEADDVIEARMEGMSRTVFEAMIVKAQRREAEFRALIAKAVDRAPPLQPRQANATSSHGPGQQAARVVQTTGRGRPRTAQEKSEKVITLSATGMTRQAIASELGIGLASVYRILKENRTKA